jgi:hypothetical protein
MSGGAPNEDSVKALVTSRTTVSECKSEVDEAGLQLEHTVMELAHRNLQLNESMNALAEATHTWNDPAVKIPADSTDLETRNLELVEQTARLAASALELSQRTARTLAQLLRTI